MVLVDTSIWIDHFRAANPQLQRLLNDTRVTMHPYIIAELACGDIGNQPDILTLLHTLIQQPVLSLTEFLHFIQSHTLYASGLGMVDVHLLGSCKLTESKIWTKDKKLKAVAARLDLLYS
ncbi:MAG: hypothetical protein KDK39_11065 [Leptospiraceae bacterium]|nr:hypothetical protein [Leptospiraceae bacterium]